MTFNLSLNPYTKKINSKRITHLNIKCRTIKILEKNIRDNLQNLGPGKTFLDFASKAQSIKEKNDKLDFIKIKAIVLCSENKKTSYRPRNSCKSHTQQRVTDSSDVTK